MRMKKFWSSFRNEATKTHEKIETVSGQLSSSNCVTCSRLAGTKQTEILSTLPKDWKPDMNKETGRQIRLYHAA